jgi:chromosome segregation ATPase
MVSKKVASSTDRKVSLSRAREEVEVELQRLLREEEYLTRQIRRAQEQLKYYEQLLSDLKQSAGRPAPLREFVRRLG